MEHTHTLHIHTTPVLLQAVVANKNESNDTAIVEDGTTGYLAPIGDRATFLDYTERLVKVSCF